MNHEITDETIQVLNDKLARRQTMPDRGVEDEAKAAIEGKQERTLAPRPEKAYE